MPLGGQPGECEEAKKSKAMKSAESQNSAIASE